MYLPVGWSYFFYNSEPTKCPIKSCTLKSKGCQTDSESVGVVLYTGPDYNVGYKEDIVEGYDDTVCLSCTNG